MKKYGIVKIKDPSTDGHTVKLLPFQSLEVTCTKTKSSFSASAVGGFFVLTETTETAGQVVFKFEQKYDVSAWANISTVFMGNVLVSNGDINIRLCVYCVSEYPRNAVVTVINPDNFLVKLEPWQLLHVVVYDLDFVHWSVDNPPSLNCVRCETVINDFESVYDPDALFCPEPRSHGLPVNHNLKDHPAEFFSNEVLGRKGIITEYHFWSCLTSDEISKVYSRANGSYGVGNITLSGEYMDKTMIHKIELMISLRGNRKNLTVDHFKTIYEFARNWNDRSLSYTRHTIFNPKMVENLDVSGSDGWFYAEIPNPSVYHPDDFGSNCEWVCEGLERNLQCHELKSRYINGKEVQRFLINGISEKIESNLMSLGTATFSASNQGVTKLITIHFWKIPLSTVMQPCRPHHRGVQERVEIDLEIMKDVELADDSCITPLDMIAESNITDWSDYYSGGWVAAMTNDGTADINSKKKFLILSPSGCNILMTTEHPNATNIGF